MMRNLILAGLALIAAVPASAQTTTQPNAMQTQASGAASGVLLQAGPGQVNSVNLVNGATAGFVVLYDSAAVPADGALAPSLIRWCMPVATNTGIRDGFATPIFFYAGLTVFVSSTSCTTKAAVAYGFVASQVK
jgi:hypothetical protein